MKTKVYACYNKDDNIRAASSSGGCYFLMAQNVINMGGVVYAACYDGVKVKHKRLSSQQEINLGCGAKYIPSELGDTFNSVKKDLTEKTKVLFTGTPCQCGGLLSFLECDGVSHNNLWCVDFICHGIPSLLAWEMYQESLSKRGCDISKVNMRDKRTGWKQYSFTTVDNTGKEMSELHSQNPYISGFVKNLFLRPSCYCCQFKGIDRKTDITLGDYWGIDNFQPEMDDDKGTSLLFVHSKCGEELFNNISASLIYTTANFEQVVIKNPCIDSSVPMNKNREEFFSDIDAGNDFIKVINKLGKRSIIKRGCQKVKHVLKKPSSGDQ